MRGILRPLLSGVVLAIGGLASANATLAAPFPAADPRVSSLRIDPQGNGTLLVTVSLRDSAGNPTIVLDRPWLIIKAVREPFSGSLGAYSTAPSPNDTVTLAGGANLGPDHGPGVVWVTPTSADVTAVVRPQAPGAPTVVAWIVDAQGNGAPVGFGSPTPSAVSNARIPGPGDPAPCPIDTSPFLGPVPTGDGVSPAQGGPCDRYKLWAHGFVPFEPLTERFSADGVSASGAAAPFQALPDGGLQIGIRPGVPGDPTRPLRPGVRTWTFTGSTTSKTLSITVVDDGRWAAAARPSAASSPVAVVPPAPQPASPFLPQDDPPVLRTVHPVLQEFAAPEGAPDPVRFYDTVPVPQDIRLEPEVLVTNAGLAVLIAVLLALASLITNSALHVLRLSDRFHPAWIRRKVPPALQLTIITLGFVAVPFFLNGGIDLGTTSGREVALGDVLTGLALAALANASRFFYHRRAKRPATLHLFVPGLLVAGILILASRIGGLNPGLAYTAFGGVTALAVLEGRDRAVLHLTELWVPFVGGAFLWLLLLTPLGSNPLYTLFALTLFFIVAWELLFGSLPLTLTEGADVWSWQRRIAQLNLLGAVFIFVYTLINPANTFVVAVQSQRTVGFLAVVAMFLLSSALLYLGALVTTRRASGPRDPVAPAH